MKLNKFNREKIKDLLLREYATGKSVREIYPMIEEKLHLKVSYNTLCKFVAEATEEINVNMKDVVDVQTYKEKQEIINAEPLLWEHELHELYKKSETVYNILLEDLKNSLIDMSIKDKISLLSVVQKDVQLPLKSSAQVNIQNNDSDNEINITINEK